MSRVPAPEQQQSFGIDKPYTMRTSVATPAERLDEILPRLGDAAEITELPSRALQ
jgi:hypothetical protein